MAENTTGQSSIRDIDDKADIVKVVSAVLGSNNVKRKGKIYVSICPFHNDTDPSLQINPERNTYHCFACGAIGGSVKFVKEYRKVEWRDAIQEVCNICSIPLPENFRGKKTLPLIEQKFPNELKALADLREFYRLSLESKGGQDGRDYLDNRGISKDVIEHFGLGYAPDDSTLSINYLRKQGYDVQTLQNAGILSKSADFKDIFSHRIIFPIEDNTGHLVAFSGRILFKEQDSRKYLHYSETSLFLKKNILYHFSKAREDAKRNGYIYVVEGFMDVIAFVRAGINAVCGSMGTALTVDHAKAFKSLGVEVLLCLDSDEPGQSGEEAASKVLHENDVPFKIVRKFKYGKDADEVISNYGAEKLLESLKNPLDPFLFFLSRTLKGRKSLNDPTEIQLFIRNNIKYYNSLDVITKEKDVDILCKICSISKETILNLLNNYTSEKIKKDIVLNDNSKQGDDGSNKSLYNYRYFRKKEPNYINFDVKLENKYNFQQLILDFIDSVKAMPQCKEIYDQCLIENECTLMLSLTHSYEAYSEFQMKRTDFIFNPFYLLSMYIGEEYLSHPETTKAFTDYDYEHLKEIIVKNKNSKSDFDPFGDVDDAPISTIPNDVFDFMMKAIDIIKNTALKECYNHDNFISNLQLHSLYVMRNNLLKEVSLNGGEFSPEQKKKKTWLICEIKKNGGRI